MTARKPIPTWRYILTGAIIGALLGIAEALFFAIGDRDYWRRAGNNYLQLGFAGGPFGATIGYIIANRLKLRRQANNITE